MNGVVSGILQNVGEGDGKWRGSCNGTEELLEVKFGSFGV